MNRSPRPGVVKRQSLHPAHRNPNLPTLNQSNIVRTILAQADETPAAVDQVQGALDQAKATAGAALTGDSGALKMLLVDCGMPVIWAPVILIVSVVTAKILAKYACQGMEKARVDSTLAGFAAKMIFYLVVILGAIVALGKFGVNVTAFSAILAAAGFAVGMALSGTLSNFASGVMLLIFRPFKIGDVVSAAGITAKVNTIELFTTTFDTPDNRRIIVPNGEIYGGTIENISFHSERRVDVAVGCDYSAGLDETRAVLQKAAESLSDKLLSGEDRGYQIVLGDLGDSAVNWTVRFWCSASEFWPIKEALTRAVKQHLDEAGIGIPFPQMDVHVDGAVSDS
ncbi:MAG: small conductance mechanosensitive channel [Verrucomicrobiales bacterium]|jgi:small conductance mechanosensitive channel